MFIIYEQVYTPGELHIYDNVAGSRRLVMDAGGNFGFGLNDPNVRLDVNGSIEYTGTITDVSDRKIKEKFLPITDALAGILELKGYSYSMINDSEQRREYGLMAQDVQKVFPEMVSTIDTEGEYLGLSYIQLVPVLIEAIKEQQTQIDDLKIEKEVLKKQAKKINDLEVLIHQMQAQLKQQ
ncbi:MAG: tail fiber domain-containing protein [Saprospiraceae bacterium]